MSLDDAVHSMKPSLCMAMCQPRSAAVARVLGLLAHRRGSRSDDTNRARGVSASPSGVFPLCARSDILCPLRRPCIHSVRPHLPAQTISDSRRMPQRSQWPFLMHRATRRVADMRQQSSPNQPRLPHMTCLLPISTLADRHWQMTSPRPAGLTSKDTVSAVDPVRRPTAHSKRFSAESIHPSTPAALWLDAFCELILSLSSTDIPTPRNSRKPER